MDDAVRELTMTDIPAVTEDRLSKFDFQAHNAEVRAMWAAFHAGTPYRTPVILGLATRYFLNHPDANPLGLDQRRYSQDPDAMYEAQLRFQRWSRFNVLQDWELGLPETWQIHVDLQNYYDAAWFGCPIEYREGEVPDTTPAYVEQPERVMEQGIPDPFGGVLGRGLEFYEHFCARAERDSFLDRPVSIHPPWFGIGTDGVMTCACNLFGPVFVCTAMADEPDRLRSLLNFITDALIAKMRAYRARFQIAIPQDGFWMADDSIALISTRMFREFILPCLRRIYDAFATPTGRGIHLCGNAQRHFVILRDELGISAFDTGFPIDFARLRRELGPEVTIQGGPHIELLRTGTPEQVVEETRRILQSGILEGGRFILREGNNLAPGTPLENTEAMYRAAREYGLKPEVRS